MSAPEKFGEPLSQRSSIDEHLNYLSEERLVIAKRDLRLAIDSKKGKNGEPDTIHSVKILNTMENLDIILRYDPEYGGKVKECEMGGAIYFEDKIRKHLETELQTAISRDWHIEFSVDAIFRKIEEIADQYKFHPVRDFLNSLPAWDGVNRFPMLEKLMNLEENPLNIVFLTRYWIQLVARVMEPGCRAESCLTLVGTQGGETKSSFARAIAYDDVKGTGWFVQQNLDFKFGFKDTQTAVNMAWVAEIGEISQYMGNQHDNDKLKDFITCKEDVGRPAYGRKVVKTPRACVFIGTTNHLSFLREKGGSRRWWILTLKGEMNLPGIIEIRDLLMAEALHFYRQGVQWYLTTDEKAYFDQFIDSHIFDDSRIQAVLVALEALINLNPSKVENEGISFLDIRKQLDEQTQKNTNDRLLTELLNQLGWRSKKVSGSFKRWFEGEQAKQARLEKPITTFTITNPANRML